MSIESELAKRDRLLAEKSARIRELEAQLEERTCKVAACYSPSDLNVEAEWYFAFSCGCELYWDEPIPPNYCPNCGAKVVKR